MHLHLFFCLMRELVQHVVYFVNKMYFLHLKKYQVLAEVEQEFCAATEQPSDDLEDSLVCYVFL